MCRIWAYDIFESAITNRCLLLDHMERDSSSVSSCAW